MILKLLLGLRNNGHQVNVVKINGETRPVLGRSHPEEENRRANVLRQWGIESDSPRSERLATIDEPLPQRTQTILSHQVGPEVRQRITSGVDAPADSRKRNLPGTKQQARLGHTGDADDV